MERRLTEFGLTPGPVDDYFDSASVAALRQFQISAGITASGVADRGTSSHLGIWRTPPGATCTVRITVRPNQSPGARCVETRLAQLGLYTGTPDDRLDGAATRALGQYQRSILRPVTSYADSGTSSAMGIWRTPDRPICWVSLTVRPNASIGARCVETRLRQLGLRSLPADDRLDSSAMREIGQFQQSVGLPVTFIADRTTLWWMQLWRQPPSITCKVSVTVRAGSRSGARCVETRLWQLGARTTGADDYFETESAMQIGRFQYAVGLPVTHVADSATLAALGIWNPNPYPVPENSGSGRRVVYSRPQQRIWLVNADGSIYKTHRVSGRLYEPYAGTYYVYSRSLYTYSANDPSVKWMYMVRFAYGPGGGRIGFHEIPNRNGVPLQSAEQLGLPLSGGCVRQTTANARIVWDWAPIGTKVVVL